jgi:uncharacterized membrane protein
MSAALHSLERWHTAGLIDESTVERIRTWESTHSAAKPNWAVYAALAFGAVLLAAGVLLFVSAHWDNLSPAARFALVLGTLTGFHVMAALVQRSSPYLSVALHATGTVALGGAIALTGQIFHLNEHWPGGILLWALGALAGWVVLRQWPQAALSAILVPGWLACEWFSAHPRQWIPATGGLLALSLVYLSARRGAGDDAVRKALAWIGGLALPVFAIACGLERNVGSVDTEFIVACLIALGLNLGASYWLRGWSLEFNLAAIAWSATLCFFYSNHTELLRYVWYAVGSAGLAWWGIVESRAERINLGFAGFALTVIVYYFSNVMDKLGRSASLIALGILFLGGGWLLERTRRRFIAKAAEGSLEQ